MKKLFGVIVSVSLLVLLSCENPSSGKKTETPAEPALKSLTFDGIPAVLGKPKSGWAGWLVPAKDWGAVTLSSLKEVTINAVPADPEATVDWVEAREDIDHHGYPDDGFMKTGVAFLDFHTGKASFSIENYDLLVVQVIPPDNKDLSPDSKDSIFDPPNALYYVVRIIKVGSAVSTLENLSLNGAPAVLGQPSRFSDIPEESLGSVSLASLVNITVEAVKSDPKSTVDWTVVTSSRHFSFYTGKIDFGDEGGLLLVRVRAENETVSYYGFAVKGTSSGEKTLKRVTLDGVPATLGTPGEIIQFQYPRNWGTVTIPSLKDVLINAEPTDSGASVDWKRAYSVHYSFDDISGTSISTESSSSFTTGPLTFGFVENVPQIWWDDVYFTNIVFDLLLIRVTAKNGTQQYYCIEVNEGGT